jgi:hypothetical protein
VIGNYGVIRSRQTILQSATATVRAVTGELVIAGRDLGDYGDSAFNNQSKARVLVNGTLTRFEDAPGLSFDIISERAADALGGAQALKQLRLPARRQANPQSAGHGP